MVPDLTFIIKGIQYPSEITRQWLKGLVSVCICVCACVTVCGCSCSSIVKCGWKIQRLCHFLSILSYLLLNALRFTFVNAEYTFTSTSKDYTYLPTLYKVKNEWKCMDGKHRAEKMQDLHRKDHGWHYNPVKWQSRCVKATTAEKNVPWARQLASCKQVKTVVVLGSWCEWTLHFHCSILCITLTTQKLKAYKYEYCIGSPLTWWLHKSMSQFCVFSPCDASWHTGTHLSVGLI